MLICRQKPSQGILIFFSLAAVLCLSFCLNIICKQSFQKSGLLTIYVTNSVLPRHIMLKDIQFNLPKIDTRGVPFSVPSKPPLVVPGLVSVATRVASEAQSVVTGAVTSIETAVDSAVPKNCSLGVKYFCVGFSDRIDCSSLPFNASNIVPSSVTAVGNWPDVENLDRALANLTPRGIKACLIISAVFAALALVLGISSIWSPWAGRLGLISIPWTLGVSTHLCSACSVICCIPVLVLTVMLYGLRLKVKLPAGITLETGQASNQVLAALICALSMGISVIAGWLSELL